MLTAKTLRSVKSVQKGALGRKESARAGHVLMVRRFRKTMGGSEFGRQSLTSRVDLVQALADKRDRAVARLNAGQVTAPLKLKTRRASRVLGLRSVSQQGGFATVKQHEAHSKSGKVFTVQAHRRQNFREG